MTEGFAGTGASPKTLKMNEKENPKISDPRPRCALMRRGLPLLHRDNNHPFRFLPMASPSGYPRQQRPPQSASETFRVSQKERGRNTGRQIHGGTGNGSGNPVSPSLRITNIFRDAGLLTGLELAVDAVCFALPSTPQLTCMMKTRRGEAFHFHRLQTVCLLEGIFQLTGLTGDLRPRGSPLQQSFCRRPEEKAKTHQCRAAAVGRGLLHSCSLCSHQTTGKAAPNI